MWSTVHSVFYFILSFKTYSLLLTAVLCFQWPFYIKSRTKTQGSLLSSCGLTVMSCLPVSTLEVQMYLFWTIKKNFIYILILLLLLLFVFTTGYCGCEVTGNVGTFPVHVLC